jgi:hypothetical protein
VIVIFSLEFQLALRDGVVVQLKMWCDKAEAKWMLWKRFGATQPIGFCYSGSTTSTREECGVSHRTIDYDFFLSLHMEKRSGDHDGVSVVTH